MPSSTALTRLATDGRHARRAVAAAATVLLLLGAGCRKSPSPLAEADVHAALRRALDVPLPEAARLTEEAPVGPMTGSGNRLSYGMHAVDATDARVQPYVSAYLDALTETDGPVDTSVLEEALDVAPDHEDVLSLLAMARAREGRTGVAIQLLQQILAAHERPQAPAFAALAGLLADRGDVVEAIRVASDGLEAWPGHARLHALHGRLLLAEDRIDEAIAHLEQAHRVHPTDPTLSLALAEAYQRAGHHVFAMHLAEVAFWSTADLEERMAASAMVHRSLSDNVSTDEEGGVHVSLVPARPTSRSREVLEDARSTWDRRVEASMALAEQLVAEHPPSGEGAELERLALLRTWSTRLAIASQPQLPVHPVAALHVKADLAGCALGYHASVLGLHDGSFEAWFLAHPERAYAVSQCDADGLFEPSPTWDASRHVWGVSLGEVPI